MNEIPQLILAFLVGNIFGAFFFGGLWWTIKIGMTSKVSAIWFLVSQLLRTIIVLLGFYYVGNSDWKKMCACLLGFFIIRITSTRFLHRQVANYES
jgi:F1F0 ATPase subunit 2